MARAAWLWHFKTSLQKLFKHWNLTLLVDLLENGYVWYMCIYRYVYILYVKLAFLSFHLISTLSLSFWLSILFSFSNNRTFLSKTLCCLFCTHWQSLSFTQEIGWESSRFLYRILRWLMVNRLKLHYCSTIRKPTKSVSGCPHQHAKAEPAGWVVYRNTSSARCNLEMSEFLLWEWEDDYELPSTLPVAFYKNHKPSPYISIYI